MDKYLTPELKSYYMKDFEEKVIPNTDSSWKLDEGILEYLKKINENPMIQTLYSKKFGPSSSMLSSSKSYLYFTYAEEVEDVLFKDLIPVILSRYSSKDEESVCYYGFDYPELRMDDHDVVIDLGCTKDGKYFNVNNIQINFINDYPEKHNEFWEYISMNLASIKS